MRVVSYLVILLGFGLVLYGAWFAVTLTGDSIWIGLALMIFGTAGLVDNAAKEIRSLRE